MNQRPADRLRRRFLAAVGALASDWAVPNARAAGAPLSHVRRAPDTPALRPEAEALCLRYPTPAVDASLLQQGLPVGNGRLGALVGGDPAHVIVAVSDATLWEGGANDVLDAAGQFPYEARNFGSWTLLARLELLCPGHTPAAVSDYSRTLDLSNGLVRVRYRICEVHYQRDVYASHPDGAVVVHCSQHGGGHWSGAVALTGTHGETTSALTSTHAAAENGRLALEGALANQRRHAAALAMHVEGGRLHAVDGRLHFDGCNAVTLVLCSATDYVADAARGFRDPTHAPLASAQRDAATAIARGPLELLHRHVADHRALFDTMAVDLGPSTAAQRAQDTWARLQTRAAPGAAADPEFEALYLQYGRYLTIAGSRDSLPTNLQGLWQTDNAPPWSGDYHSDINLQMNYWLPDRAGLGGCFDALTRYCLAQLQSWTDHTQRLFNDPRNRFRNSSGRIDGWTVAISTNPYGGNGWWWHPSGSAWLCNSLWQHYEYTQDRAYLLRILPLLRGACAFWETRLIETEVTDEATGAPVSVLVDDADWSPEHGPENARGISYAQELVWDLFDHYRTACETLSVEPAHASTIAALQRRLYLPRISPTRHALEEWMTPDDLGEPQHRHLSPLFGLFPGDRITADGSPQALLDACARLLHDRGMASFGWACAWRSLCWSRLHDAEKAYALVIANLKPSIDNSNGTAPNLFDVYSFGSLSSCFQIDANFGTPTAMLDMLLYSRPGTIELLPALPAAWAASGHVTGIGARGGFVVDLRWSEGRVRQARVRSIGGRRTVLKAGGQTRTLAFEPSETIDLTFDD